MAAQSDDDLAWKPIKTGIAETYLAHVKEWTGPCGLREFVANTWDVWGASYGDLRFDRVIRDASSKVVRADKTVKTYTGPEDLILVSCPRLAKQLGFIAIRSNPIDPATLADMDVVAFDDDMSFILRDAMLLGGQDTKVQRGATVGCFGEGMKVGAVVLLRKLIPYWEDDLRRSSPELAIMTGGKKYVFTFRQTGGARQRTLVVIRRSLGAKQSDKPALDPLVTPHTKWGQWAHVHTIKRFEGLPRRLASTFLETMVLPLMSLYQAKPVAAIECGAEQASILMDPEQAGNIYNKGFLICHKPGVLFGYNFHSPNHLAGSMPMLRDRSTVSDHWLRAALGRAWSQVSDPVTLDQFWERVDARPDAAELVAAMETSGNHRDRIAIALMERFRAVRGPTAFVVKKGSDAEHEAVRRVFRKEPFPVSVELRRLLKHGGAESVAASLARQRSSADSTIPVDPAIALHITTAIRRAFADTRGVEFKCSAAFDPEDSPCFASADNGVLLLSHELLSPEFAHRLLQHQPCRGGCPAVGLPGLGLSDCCVSAILLAVHCDGHAGKSDSFSRRVQRTVRMANVLYRKPTADHIPVVVNDDEDEDDDEDEGESAAVMEGVGHEQGQVKQEANSGLGNRAKRTRPVPVGAGDESLGPPTPKRTKLDSHLDRAMHHLRCIRAHQEPQCVQQNQK